MKNISLIKFINLLFISVGLILLLLFWGYLIIDEQKYNFEQKQRYELIASNLITQLDDPVQLKQWYDHYNVYPIQDSANELKLKILNEANTIYQKELINSRIRIFVHEANKYIYLQSRGYNIMLQDLQKRDYSATIVFSLFSFIFLLLLVLYMILMKKLAPLKNLHQAIIEFSHGNMNVNITNDSKDEIGQISQSFNNAVINIKKLIESRNLFMRNMMHELKTPITKGHFLVEMLEDKETQKQSLKKLFQDMNDLVNSLANIEKATMAQQQLIKEKLDIALLLDQILLMLEIPKEKVMIKKQSSKAMYANKELFMIVLKNLIENGMKYTNSFPIVIHIKENEILFESTSQKLKYDLEYYLQPFSQETKNSKGFGLGLYIVSEILKLHSMNLAYKHNNGINSFIIEF